MVRVRVRGLVLVPLGPWAIWVPGSLGPPGPAFWCESVPWCRKRGRSRVGVMHGLEEVWRKNKNDTCAWTPNKVFMRLGSLGTWAWVPRLGGERKS